METWNDTQIHGDIGTQGAQGLGSPVTLPTVTEIN